MTMRSLRERTLGYVFAVLCLMTTPSPTSVQCQTIMSSFVSPSVTIVAPLLTSNAVSTTPTPHTPLYPPCSGEFSVSTPLPSDSLFELVINSIVVLNEFQVNILLGQLEALLEEYCDEPNNINQCMSVTDEALTQGTNLTAIYSCSLDTNQILLGLVYTHNNDTISAESAIFLIESELDKSLLQFSVYAREATQNVTTSEPTTEGSGLTTDQIIGIGVGIATTMLLVSVLTGMLIILSVRSNKAANLALSPIHTAQNSERLASVTSPVLVPHGDGVANKDTLATAS